jgi:cell division protein FtsW (lipid II flippase)
VRIRAERLRLALHWPVLAPMALLLLLGVAVLGGLVVRIGTTWVDDLHVTQLSGIGVGIAAAVGLCMVPYKALVQRAYLLYAFCLLLQVLVLVVGAERNGSRRWLQAFGVEFQPSELMKLALVITLARFIRFRSSYKTFRGLGAPFVLTLVPMALILVQPDLGTALLCMPVLFVMLFAAGARTRHLATILLLGALAILPVYRWGLRSYQRDRIDGFVAQLPFLGDSRTEAERAELERDELFQALRARIAIGAGGIAGADDDGQSLALRSVPERQNDFVFAAVGNRWGLLGGIAVLALFGWLLLAILLVAARHRDPAGRLLCIGVFALLGFQAFINIAMTVGLMPITGTTLPFLSAGRSSIVVSMLAVALVCNVAARPSYEFGRGDFD